MAEPGEYHPLGEGAVVWRAGAAIDEALSRRLRAVADYLTQHPFPGYEAAVPAYLTLTVFYDPLAADHAAARAHVQRAVAAAATAEPAEARTVELPVRYDGPDLDVVAQHADLTTAEVIERHTAPAYLVHFVGFLPGFAYLGGLDPRLTTRRRAAPRRRVPAGAVGIAGAQTGVYPLDSPGGWQLIGRTDAVLFDPRRTPPARLRAGDRVRFVPQHD